MRTLVHLSDLHFGRVDQSLIAPLTALIARTAPDVLVVSGDLTQRARSSEFIAARTFLDTLQPCRIVVPGNHDISLHNLLDRFVRPLARYTRYITNDLQPFYQDDEIAIAGINTARSMTIKDGRISRTQIDQLQKRFSRVADDVIKVVVSHHPFDLPGNYAPGALVGRADAAIDTLAACGVDLLLAGHLHASHAGTTASRYPIDGYAALTVQAGTATSTRGRGEANSFNIIRIEPQQIIIDRITWNVTNASFELAGSENFRREGRRWLHVTSHRATL